MGKNDKAADSKNPAQDDIGFSFKKIDDCITSESNRELQAFGITASQVRTLEYLAMRKDQKTSLRDIEGYLHVAHPTIVGLVHRLSNKGYVEVNVDDNDRRYRQVFITEPGQDILHRTQSVRKDIEKRMIRGLSKDEVERLRSYLTKISDNLEA